MAWRATVPGLALLAALVAGGAPLQASASADTSAAADDAVLPFDPAHSAVGFHLRTRWGQRLDGTFPVHAGEVRLHPDGRREVRVRLDTAAMELTGHPRYTRWARGPEFFDVARFPAIEFRSETYDAALLHEGGALHGTLTMRGVSRPVRFEVEPSACDAPGTGCDVVASGTVDRTAFGMDAWRVAIGDAVRFHLRVRTQPGGDGR